MLSPPCESEEVTCLPSDICLTAGSDLRLKALETSSKKLTSPRLPDMAADAPLRAPVSVDFLRRLSKDLSSYIPVDGAISDESIK